MQQKLTHIRKIKEKGMKKYQFQFYRAICEDQNVVLVKIYSIRDEFGNLKESSPLFLTSFIVDDWMEEFILHSYIQPLRKQDGTYRIEVCIMSVREDLIQKYYINRGILAKKYNLVSVVCRQRQNYIRNINGDVDDYRLKNYAILEHYDPRIHIGPDVIDTLRDVTYCKNLEEDSTIPYVSEQTNQDDLYYSIPYEIFLTFLYKKDTTKFSSPETIQLFVGTETIDPMIWIDKSSQKPGSNIEFTMTLNVPLHQVILVFINHSHFGTMIFKKDHYYYWIS